MSATFIERCIRVGDYDNDGGIIDLETFEDFLYLYEASASGIDGDFMETAFSLTPAQRAQLDDILATRPATLLTALNATARSRWAHTIFSVLRCGVRAMPEMDTDAKVSAFLGI